MTSTDQNPCPTNETCILTGPQHDDWMHRDTRGNEWPVTTAEVVHDLARGGGRAFDADRRHEAER